VVAFVGVLAALLALQLERTRQLGVYRALGLLPRQLRAMVMLETSLLGLLAGLLALPAGVALAAAMVFVINRRSFGWTMDFEVLPGQLVGAVALAVVAAALAGLYPAWRMAATSPAQALREE
jgi:putative ABC transport system permease protein